MTTRQVSKIHATEASITPEKDVDIVASNTLSSKGQVVIPVEIRRSLNAQPGDEIRFTAKAGHVEIKVVKQVSIMDLVDIFKTNVAYQPMEQIRERVYRDMVTEELGHEEEED